MRHPMKALWAITILNSACVLGLAAVVATKPGSASPEGTSPEETVRARGLEIVDDNGTVPASLTAPQGNSELRLMDLFGQTRVLLFLRAGAGPSLWLYGQPPFDANRDARMKGYAAYIKMRIDGFDQKPAIQVFGDTDETWPVWNAPPSRAPKR